ncbi:hypothetical protein ASD15_06475 [Massilia sp. Root351]|jgi:ABC-2 type transport system permease protein|uniref:DUF3526 domain-containing protein n=1 Tax=Massilia sp. Root351 TaxID=1736522 RepID=UPI0007106E67|nr:DUF3526 domain-containing protein [Massilia sp. Root351]KQV84802.1 hypothetical protein ASD15_06475 [Massilia sp. Root351]
MKQILALIRYDLLMQLRERGTLLLLAAALLLAGYGLFEGSRFERQGQAARADAARQEHEARLRAGQMAERYFANPEAGEFAVLQWYRTPVDIRGYAFREHVGFAAKPAVPGAALGIAQADILPAYVRVRAESMESVRTAAEIEHPGRLAAGRYDLLFFLVYLWPLILLSLCMSVLTQDRESRRLRSLQLQGLSPLRLLLVQTGARALAATLVLLLFCVAAALLSAAVPATVAGCSALAAWSAVVLAYSAFWAAVATAICAVCATRMSAAFAVSGAWLVFAIVIPGALSAWVQLAAPVPNREYYVQAMRDAGDRVAADKLNSLARFYDSHPEWKPSKTPLDKVSSSVSRIQRAQALESAMRGVEQKFDSARRNRDALFGVAAFFSPVTLAYQALAHIAGNDSARQQRFIAEVQQHHGQLRDYFQAEIQRAALGDERNPCPRTCLGGYGFRDFAQVPRFSASAQLAAAPALPARAALLLLWTGLLAAAAVLLLRYVSRSQATP